MIRESSVSVDTRLLQIDSKARATDINTWQEFRLPGCDVVSLLNYILHIPHCGEPTLTSLIPERLTISIAILTSVRRFIDSYITLLLTPR